MKNDYTVLFLFIFKHSVQWTVMLGDDRVITLSLLCSLLHCFKQYPQFLRTNQVKMVSKSILLLVILVTNDYVFTSSFSIVMMGARRGKGNLKKGFADDSGSKSNSSPASLNNGKGQEITGVSLPAEGTKT